MNTSNFAVRDYESEVAVYVRLRTKEARQWAERYGDRYLLTTVCLSPDSTELYDDDPTHQTHDLYRFEGSEAVEKIFAWASQNGIPVQPPPADSYTAEYEAEMAYERYLEDRGAAAHIGSDEEHADRLYAAQMAGRSRRIA